MLVMPSVRKTLSLVGEQIRLARCRRNLSCALVAERAGISRATLYLIEKGTPSVSIGAYAMVLLALGGLQNDLLAIARDDVLGRTLQDLGLKIRQRASKQRKSF